MEFTATSALNSPAIGEGGKKRRILARVDAVAEMLDLGRSKTYALVKAGVIPSVRIGGSVRVPLDSLDEWLDALKG